MGNTTQQFLSGIRAHVGQTAWDITSKQLFVYTGKKWVTTSEGSDISPLYIGHVRNEVYPDLVGWYLDHGSAFLVWGNDPDDEAIIYVEAMCVWYPSHPPTKQQGVILKWVGDHLAFEGNLQESHSVYHTGDHHKVDKILNLDVIGKQVHQAVTKFFENMQV